MADAKEAAPKKKANMMPVIAALILVLGGGGFFMMNKGGGEKASEPEIALAHHGAEDVGEYLVNLKDGSYLSTKIALHCAEGETVSSAGDGHGKGGEVYPFVKDAIISVLTSKTLDGITSVEGKQQLRRELAYRVNHAAHTFMHKEEKGSKKKSKKDEDHGHSDGVPEELKPGYEPEYPEWDSDEGPVLKVFFMTFTTQR